MLTYILTLDIMQSLTARSLVMPAESTEPTLYSGLKWQSDLHVHTNYISNRLLSSTGVSVEDALLMDQSLDTWSRSLPAYFNFDQQVSSQDPAFQFARHRLWWRFWNLKIILFRQLLLTQAVARHNHAIVTPFSDMDMRSRSTATNAASATIVSIDSYSRTGVISKLAAWYSM